MCHNQPKVADNSTDKETFKTKFSHFIKSLGKDVSLYPDGTSINWYDPSGEKFEKHVSRAF